MGLFASQKLHVFFQCNTFLILNLINAQVLIILNAPMGLESLTYSYHKFEAIHVMEHMG